MRRKMRSKRSYGRKTGGYVKRIAKRVAKRVVGRLAERKYATSTTGTISYNSSITSAADLTEIIPLVAQGNRSNQRVGTKITPKRLIVRGTIQANQTSDNVLPPLEAWMYILRHKVKQNFANMDAGDTYFLQGGSARAQFDGTFTNTALPIDYATYELVAKKRFRLQSAPPTAITSAPSNAALVALNSAMGPSGKRFAIAFRPKGPFLYEEDDATGRCINRNYFMAVGYNYLPGRAPDVVDTKVQVQYSTHLYYTDV